MILLKVFFNLNYKKYFIIIQLKFRNKYYPKYSKVKVKIMKNSI